jgi:transposase InsO family protein
MPWEETCAMEERLKFVAACLAGDEPMAWICERFGISRKTGYKWLERFRVAGPSGLEDRPRARLEPARMAPDLRDAILALRRDKPHWGPLKLRAKLGERHPELIWPAASSIGDLLRRLGLNQSRRLRRRTPPYTQPLAHAGAANDVWCADYKGWVRSGDGRRCDPLTVTDAFSRFLLAADLVPRLDTEHARPVFERLFAEHGLPAAIRTDNGAPFASTGAGGLSALSIWWLKLGIRPERIEPGKPQQNGRHERMHRTMLEAMSPPAATAAAQQARLDAFRAEFNHERPHEALGQRAPARFYARSHRPYDERLREPVYDQEQAVRKVRCNGEIRWAGGMVYIGEALVGEPIALSETADGPMAVHYFDVFLGYLDKGATKIRRPGRGHAPALGNEVSPMCPV